LKSNSKSFKIVSRFYVIYGDGIPIYVGYTNRTVKQRFVEHKHDKDFSDYSSVGSIELKDQRMSFNFTWDYNKTCKNADKVSEREEYLVNKYCTQETCYQKADGGGQTWASEKWFVKTNKDNPRFRGMSGAEIKIRIESEKIVSRNITDFVKDMIPQYQVDISHFVTHMKPKYQQNIGDFVNIMKPKYKQNVSSFVSTMKTKYQQNISDFVNTMKPQYQVNIGSFVTNIKPKYQQNISDFVNHMRTQYQVDIKNFVGNMRSPIKQVLVNQ